MLFFQLKKNWKINKIFLDFYEIEERNEAFNKIRKSEIKYEGEKNGKRILKFRNNRKFKR